MASNYNIKTISFPPISTGIYGYPVKEASLVAMKVVCSYEDDFEEINIVCFDENTLKVYEHALELVKKGINL